MITIVVPKTQLFVEGTNHLIPISETKLQLEHSLISLKKWEQKWHIPFLDTNRQLTDEQVNDYIKCMTITPTNVDPNVYSALTDENKIEIFKYIENSMTATWFNELQSPKGGNPFYKEVITNEIIYYWMIELGIPVEFQKWHLNALLTLIKVVNIKRSPKKKMSAQEAAAQRRALNAQRRAKLKSKG